MAKAVTIDNLAAEIALAVEQYTDDVSEAIEAELAQTAEQVHQDIVANSPVATGKYKKGWRVKREAAGSGQLRYIVYQKTKPWLAHLLEFGHAKVNGGRVGAKTTDAGHIRPAYDRNVPAMEERIKRIIAGGGRV